MVGSGSSITQTPDFLMRVALQQARRAASSGEVPVGAVVVGPAGDLLAEAHNEVERLQDATAHAELLALRRASAVRGSWRLEGCSLFVTLEPCVMCIGAILHTRIDRLYFGAYDPVQGAVGSLFDLSALVQLPRQVKTYPELLAEESSALLRQFFASRRE